MALAKGTIGHVQAWSAKVVGYAKDGRVVFERIPHDGKRYATEERNFHVQVLHEDTDDGEL